MHSTKGVLLLIILSVVVISGQKQKRPPNVPSPIDSIKPQENFDPKRFSGKWYLIGVASECNYLREYNHQTEATAMVVSQMPVENNHAVSTFRKLDGLCWEIKQEYEITKVKGKFSQKANGIKIDIVVGKTDYSNYAIIYYQKLKKITLKLYGRNPSVAPDIVQQFEQNAMNQKINEDFIYYFPKYGFCDSADEFHILTVK
ncbi:complement component C8 gamma chain [Protopterus annectens]|uniref:complement component C8 gamma chain n=1 Tax=Protopterus annectens TaxID=7888 RepID=UPI001CFC3641|nr:complement component C8 gamma chain [Protopterus annectens]